VANKFGLTHDEHMTLDMSSHQKTAQWLRASRDAERNKVHDGGIKGLNLTHYKDIAVKLDGLQVGMHGILSKANIGKSTLLTSMAIDVMDTASASSPVKSIIYTFDDDIDYMRHMLVAFKAKVSRKGVDRRNDHPEQSRKVEAAYEELQDYAERGLFVVKGVEDIRTLEELIDDIENENNLLMSLGYDNPKMCVFLDGQANLDTSISNIREANIAKASKLQEVAKLLKIPIVLTLEVPKLNGKWRPGKEDVMESVKYSFNCVSMIALSPVDDETEHGDGYPVMSLEFVKNKFGGFKGTLFALRKGSQAYFEMATREQEQGFQNMAIAFEKSYGAKK